MQTQFSSLHKEIYFSIESKEELSKAFRIRDQKKLILPENLKFPLNIQYYFTWKEPSGNYTYLVAKMPNWDLPRGVAFSERPPQVSLLAGSAIGVMPMEHLKT